MEEHDRGTRSFPTRFLPTGLWCHGIPCLISTCDIAELFDSDTSASAGTDAFCGWKDENTAFVIFGEGGFSRPGVGIIR